MIGGSKYFMKGNHVVKSCFYRVPNKSHTNPDKSLRFLYLEIRIKSVDICLKRILPSLDVARGSVDVKALSYKPEGRGFETR
jgi:hypothetical protein